jgi:hypothetical protein
MGLGRIGNHINGEVFGSVTNLPWATGFPYAEGCRHPVALYDGLKNLLLLPILLGVRFAYRRAGYEPASGILFGHFVFWYGSLRLFVDVFRSTILTGWGWSRAVFQPCHGARGPVASPPGAPPGPPSPNPGTTKRPSDRSRPPTRGGLGSRKGTFRGLGNLLLVHPERLDPAGAGRLRAKGVRRFRRGKLPDGNRTGLATLGPYYVG